MRRWLVPVLLVVLAVTVGALAVVLFAGSDDSSAEAVILEPVNSTGEDPFTASIATGERAELPETARTAASSLTTDPDTGGLTAPGTTPGLYGGTQDESVCDVDRLVEFLSSNPAKAAAWAGVLDIRPRAVGTYVAGLTPVVLTADTRVTNHGYRDGAATTFQAVLQAGTAVLVDARGVPRVKCGCGNPLTEPSDVAAPAADPWPGYRPDIVVIVTPAPRRAPDLVLVDIDTGATYEQPIDRSGGGSTWLASIRSVSGGFETGSILMSSPDGRTWRTARPAEAGVWINGLAYGDGRWLAVGYAYDLPIDPNSFGAFTDPPGTGVVLSSEDGERWERVATVDANLTAIAYGDSRWLALGNRLNSSAEPGGVFQSTNGTEWEQIASIADNPSSEYRRYYTPKTVTYANGLWVAGVLEAGTTCTNYACSGGVVLTSRDGRSWARGTEQYRGPGVTHGDGTWVLWSNGRANPAVFDQYDDVLLLEESTDLESWTPITAPFLSTTEIAVVAFGGSWLVATPTQSAESTDLFTSMDLRSWSKVGSLDDQVAAIARGG